MGKGRYALGLGKSVLFISASGCKLWVWGINWIFFPSFKWAQSFFLASQEGWCAEMHMQGTQIGCCLWRSCKYLVRVPGEQPQMEKLSELPSKCSFSLQGFLTCCYSLYMSQAVRSLLIALTDVAGVEVDVTHWAENYVSVLNRLTISLTLLLLSIQVSPRKTQCKCKVATGLSQTVRW